LSTSLDPQQRNRYTYTSNNPMTRYDLTGYAWCGPSAWDRLRGAGEWVSSSAGDWWEGVQVGMDNPSALLDATQQFGYEFFVEDFAVAFSSSSSLSDRMGALGMVALNFVPGGKLGQLGKLSKVAKLADRIAEASKGLRYADEVVDAGKIASRTSNFTSGINAQAALHAKLSGLEKAQKTAARIRQLPDSRIRYYSKEISARKAGKTRGASFVTEYDPNTGRVRQWMESYDHSGKVVRVHPKSVNGQTVMSKHYPPTGREL